MNDEQQKISISRLNSFMKCPRQFDYIYNQKKTVPANSAFLFGESMDYMLREVFNKNFSSYESLCSRWDWYWKQKISGELLDDKPKKKAIVHENKDGRIRKIYVGNHVRFLTDDPYKEYYAFRNKGRTILSVFFESEKEAATAYRLSPKHERPIDLNVSFKESFRGHDLVGRIDRVEKNQEGLSVIEYKAGNGEYRHEDDIRQLVFYSAAASSRFSNDDITAVLWHLKSGDKESFSVSEEHYDGLEKDVDYYLKNLDQEPYLPLPGNHCYLCDYQNMCSKDKKMNQQRLFE